MTRTLTAQEVSQGHFLAISVSGARLTDLAAWSQSAARAFAGGFAATAPGAGLWVSAGLSLDDAPESMVVVARQPTQISSGDRRPVGLAAIAQAWRQGKPPRSDDYTAPFNLAAFDRRDGSLMALTDHAGLGHLYLYADSGVTAVCSSSLILARMFRLRPALDALMGLAVTGAFIGHDCAFEGVSKLPAGHVASLRDGRLATDRSARPYGVSHADGAAVLYAVVGGLSDSFPHAEIELSGGLDSRLILSGFEPDRRSQHPALTIGGPGSADRTLAARICALWNIPHKIVDPAELVDDHLGDHLRLTAVGDQFGSNPLDRALISSLEVDHNPAVRFSGQNGESLRGFYYPYQPIDAAPSEGLARQLVRARMVVNDVVDPNLFDAAWYRPRRAAVEDRLTATIMACPGERWSEKLDHLYLTERMQRWCGVAFSKVQHERQILAPFFDRDLIEFAFSLPGREKVDSRAAARLLAAMDPVLAKMPLDTGIAPVRMLDASLGAKLARSTLRIDKIRRKIIQRLSRASLIDANTADVGVEWWKRAGPDRLNLAALADWGVFNPRMLEAFASGRWRPGRATLGFIINCACIAEVREAT